MNAYIVRSKKGVTDKPYVGLFVAPNRFELFHAIDEFADPYAFEYASLDMPTGLLLSIDREFSRDPDDDRDEEGFEFVADSFGEHLDGMAYVGDVVWRDLPPADQIYARMRAATKKEAAE